MFAALLRLIELDYNFAFEFLVGQLRSQEGDMVPVVHALDCLLDFTLVYWLPNTRPNELVDQKEVVPII